MVGGDLTYHSVADVALVVETGLVVGHASGPLPLPVPERTAGAGAWAASGEAVRHGRSLDRPSLGNDLGRGERRGEERRIRRVRRVRRIRRVRRGRRGRRSETVRGGEGQKDGVEEGKEEGEGTVSGEIHDQVESGGGSCACPPP
jgi:hypothetical protein